MAGSGLNLRPMVELPDGVVFPLEYHISARAVYKAFRKALTRRPNLAADEYRSVAHDRLETLYLATQGGVARGDPPAIRTAVAVVHEHAHILGYVRADPEQPAAASDRQYEEERRHMLALARAMSDEDRANYLDILQRAEACVKAGKPEACVKAGKPPEVPK
jgi:hypothetical protein